LKLRLSTVERKRLVYCKIQEGKSYSEAVNEVKRLEEQINENHTKMERQRTQAESQGAIKKAEAEAVFKSGLVGIGFSNPATSGRKEVGIQKQIAEDKFKEDFRKLKYKPKQ
jgi:hypothetical protein